MHDIIICSGDESLTDPSCHIEDEIFTQGLFADHTFDVPSLHIFHNDVAQIPFRVHLYVGDSDDMGGVDPARQTGFADQCFKRNISHGSCTVGSQQFQGTFPIKEIMPCKINFSHTAGTHTAFDGIVSQNIVAGQIRV